MTNNIFKTIGITAAVVTAIAAVVAWKMWPSTIPRPTISIESIVAQGKFNGADLVLQSAYTVCPSKHRKYLIVFSGRVPYVIDTQHNKLTLSETPAGSGNWKVIAPAITLSNYANDIDSTSGKEIKKAWVINGSFFVNDTAKSAEELKLINNYAMHIAMDRLTKSDEVTKAMTEQVSQFVMGVLIAANKEPKSVDVQFFKSPEQKLPPVNIPFCTDDSGMSVKL